jgi:DNA (cytosine-5)-methyltransferase 1
MPKFTFADVFAGIGGFRIAAEHYGGICNHTVEIKKNALAVYSLNFGDTPLVDIEKLLPTDIPHSEFVFAGWPCQPFSNIGQHKGYHDKTQGTLFFHLVNYLAVAKPSYFILENVRGLVSKEKDFQVVIDNLRNVLGYTVHYKIIKASEAAFPQHRPRVYIVGYKGNEEFEWPKSRNLLFTMSNVLRGDCPRQIGLTLREKGKRSPIDDRHNWDGYWVNGKEHRLTFGEAKLMQGFDIEFKKPDTMSDSIGIGLLGNSVSIPVVESVLVQLLLARERQIGKSKAQ